MILLEAMEFEEKQQKNSGYGIELKKQGEYLMN